MSRVREIQAAIAKLTQKELDELSEWFEDQLEISDEVESRLDESRAQIASGQCRTRQP
jgi:ABC-type phosphate transport system ATPase subunit